MKHFISFIICVLFLLITEKIMAQSTVPVVNTSTSALSGTTVLQARSMITLGAGFSYTPSGGTFTTQIVDPLVSGSVSYYSSQTSPSTRSISTSYMPGTLPGSVDVSQFGSAGYSIPIEVPNGVDGFTPSLAINYSSMSDDGILGKGWGISGLGEIIRVASTKYYDAIVDGVDYDSYDRFSLNGQRLILYSGTYGSSGSEYRLEQNQSVKITYSSDYFIVKTSDGTTYEYGNSLDSKVSGNLSNTYSWQLNKIINNYGQIIYISYANVDGYAYPALIQYGLATIEFNYVNRNNDRVFYVFGNSFKLENLLDNIKVWNSGSLIRKYQFNYFKTPEYELPLLSEITYFGMNSEQLNSTQFNYNVNTSVDLDQQLYNQTHNYISYKSSMFAGDFNGDGKQDLLCIPNADNGATWTTWKVYYSNGDDSFDAGPVKDPGTTLSDLNDVVVIDLNADGKDDVIYDKKVISDDTRYSYFYYMINNGSSFSDPILLNSVVSDAYTGFFEKLFRSNNKLKDKCGINTTDFNGDGKTDIFINGPGGAYCIYSMVDLASFTLIGSGTISTLKDVLFTGDFDGDGKTDVWNFEDNTLRIYSLSGNSLSEIYSTGAIGKNYLFTPGDFNGDGKQDIFVYGYNDDDTYNDYSIWQVWLSTGKGFSVNYINQLKVNLYDHQVRIADFNGDGATDLMVYTNGVGASGGTVTGDGVSYYMSKNNGSAFCTYEWVSTHVITHKIILGDFDGDGRDDLIWTDGESPWWLGYQIYRSPGYNQDLLSEISNGLGHYSTITYVPLSGTSASSVYSRGTDATFPLYTFQGALNVASKVESNNGIGGALTVSYKYQGAKIHRLGKGFLGFSKVITTNEATGIISQNNYDINTTYIFPMLTSSVTKYGSSGTMQTVDNTWSVKSLTSKRIIPYISSSTQSNNLTGFVTTTTTSVPDDYGNILSQSVAYTNGPTQSKTIVYNNDATNWLVARPCSTTTTQSQSGDADIVQLVTTTYESGKVKPDLIKYYDGSTLKKQLNHDYNSNGTLSAYHEYSVDLGEKHAYYYYDASGINLTSKTLPDGTTETYTCYATSGLVNTMTDYWGNVKTFSYDNFGNVSATSQTSGIGISSNTLAWVASPTNARYSVTQTMTDGSQSVAYYDVLGREIRKGAKNFNGSLSCTQTDYNALGQAYRVSEPFLSTGSATLWNTTTYDNYGRVSTYTPSVGASSSYSYSGGTTTVTNNGRTYTTVTTNATGWPSSKSDPGGSISYLYKADGNVKQVTAPGSVTTTMTYDSYGNQLTLADPSAGSSTYTYYGGGELHTQVTPLGTTTNYYLADGRLDYYTNPAGTYDYTYGDNKQVSGITSPGSVSRSYTYYSNGKVYEISETIESGQTNKITFVYDSYGRVSSKTYNDAYTEGYVYNSYGYLDQVTFNGSVVYDVNTMNIRRQVTAASINGSAVTWGYNSYGQLISSSNGYSYSHNTSTGNLDSRTYSSSTLDLTTGNTTTNSLSESFYYDTSDRLDYVTKGGTTTLDLGYDTYGNLTTKSDAGTLVYNLSEKPYAVRYVNPYDTINFPSSSQSISYTSFGKVSTITEGDYSASFKYNADNERIKMVINQSGSAIKTKYYFAGCYEKVVTGTASTEYIWIGGDPYTAIAVAQISGSWITYCSILRDNLGSIIEVRKGKSCTTNGIICQISTGSLASYYSFDAYGRRRDKDTWSYTIDDPNALFADRGFTGHEYLEQFGLYNMNGRLYDPLVGRFLSPDNYVQEPEFTQSYNRYGYCLNNPLRYTDPEGDTPVNLIAAGIGAVIGGVINLSLNWNNCDGFWEYAAAFGVGAVGGAASGALLGTDGGASFWAIVGVGAASGALTSGTNDIIAQTTNNFHGAVDWNHVGQMSASGFVAGGLSSAVGYSISTSTLINGTIKSPMLRSLIASPVTSGVGYWAGGTTYGMLNGQKFSEASNNAFDGIGRSMVVGTAIGLGATYISSKANGIDPWTGKAITGSNIRTEPYSLSEKLALEEAQSGQGAEIMKGEINDPQWKGWQKIEYTHRMPNGNNITIHYWKNSVTNALAGFKFKTPPH